LASFSRLSTSPAIAKARLGIGRASAKISQM
jgi:hypothetical protein